MTTAPPRARTPRPQQQQARQQQPRRADPRLRTAEALSTRATQTLIRRNLCPAQHQQKQASSAQPPPLDSLLPPLTSRNDVDVEIYALLAIVVRDFVRTWYAGITPDDDFVAEVVHLIAHCTRALEQRLRKLDVEALLLHDLPQILDQHVSAYRTAHSSVPYQPRVDERYAYHALVPLPFLTPVPRHSDSDELRENERAHRQLLIQAVLALLLPTEDLENPCLVALVGQIFSDLIIGAILIDKATQPWLLLEAICSAATTLRAKQAQKEKRSEEERQPAFRETPLPKLVLTWAHTLLLSMIHLGLALLALARWLLDMGVRAPSLPPRWVHRSQNPQAKMPVVDFAAWSCAGNLLELHERMPWLTGILSLVHLGAVDGPGRIAGLDGTLDRFLSHHIHALLTPSLIAPALRSLRALVFPNNAPLGPSSLRAPVTDAHVDALRRRAAAALAALVPSSLGRFFFGAQWSSSPAPDAPCSEAVLDEIEHLLGVLNDQYCNKHLVYSIIHLVLVKLMPELEDQGAGELWAERLG